MVGSGYTANFPLCFRPVVICISGGAFVCRASVDISLRHTSQLVVSKSSKISPCVGLLRQLTEKVRHNPYCVILFDEIDRLILDRDSKAYSEQSDVFQFMTPSMLIKIQE